MNVDLLTPDGYQHLPWKNGKGVLIQIAGFSGGDWNHGALPWHYGRTTIATATPFSDLTGYERLQTVIKGEGLVLETPDGEIDLRRPFQIQRYDGATPIMVRLEKGAVEVANLIALRDKFRIDMQVAAAGQSATLAAGDHIVHAAVEPVCLRLRGTDYALGADHALRISGAEEDGLRIDEGRALIASVSAR